MKVLDRGAFAVTGKVAGLKVPTHSVLAVSKRFKHWQLKVPKMPAVAQLSDDDTDRSTHRLFLFSPNHVQLGDAFQEGDRTFLLQYGVDLADIQQYTVNLTYENFTYDDVLDAILPRDFAVGGFSVIGHIAHLNLKDELLEYKNIIGCFHL